MNLIRVESKILEKEIINTNSEGKPLEHKELDYKSRKLIKAMVFKGVLKIIESKRTYMLSPEKTETARFISNHYDDVFRFLEKIKRNNK